MSSVVVAEQLSVQNRRNRMPERQQGPLQAHHRYDGGVNPKNRLQLRVRKLSPMVATREGGGWVVSRIGIRSTVWIAP